MSTIIDILKLPEKTYAQAQFNMGLMYQSGKGVPKDYAEAA